MPTPPGYAIVFDLSTAGYKSWSFPAFGLIFITIGSTLVFAPRLMQVLLPGGVQSTSRRIFSWCFLGFALLWTAVSFLGTFGQYWSLKRAEEAGNYRVVEGLVQNFQPMPYGGHAMERFQVQGVWFSYSDYVVVASFNNTASHGGPIRAGLPVRISYIGNSIIKLEVRSDQVPTSAETAEYTEKEKSSWEHTQATNPLTNHIRLGFILAVLLIAALWNINWQHYIRYWLHSGPPYQRSWEVAFRLFFAVSLVGAVWQFIREATLTPRSLQDWTAASIDGALVVGAFLLIDAFFRWRFRRQKRST